LKKATEASQPESVPQSTSPTEPLPASGLLHISVTNPPLTPSFQPTSSVGSTQSTPVTHSTSFNLLSVGAPSTPARLPKRRVQEAELEDLGIEIKRKCPPSRHWPLRTVVEPSLYVLDSLIQYCRKWL
jgi:hypothetical protein